jgi:hypothetical protein
VTFSLTFDKSTLAFYQKVKKKINKKKYLFIKKNIGYAFRDDVYLHQQKKIFIYKKN